MRELQCLRYKLYLANAARFEFDVEASGVAFNVLVNLLLCQSDARSASLMEMPERNTLLRTSAANRKKRRRSGRGS